MGFIYIIQNNINDKVYIGQTTRTVEIRWNEHIRCAKSIRKSKSKLYQAMAKIGIEHFEIKTLFECDNSTLDDEEQYYINQYNSYKDGYNSTPGGLQYKNSCLEPEWLCSMLDDYMHNFGYKELAIKYKVSLPYINKLLGNNKEYKRDTSKYDGNIRKPVLMYDKNFVNPIYFNSLNDAVKYINQNTEYSASKFNGYTYITKACTVGNIAYGHHWQMVNNLYYDNMTFRSIFDIEAYKKGYNIIDDTCGYYICEHALDNIIIDHNTYCRKCGKIISKGAELCMHCISEEKRSNIPDIQTLHSLLSQYSYEAIGRMYNVTGKAVRKWADSYNLVESQQRDSSGVTCVELNIHFNTFKEAAEYLINNGLTSATNVSTLGYRISQAKKNNTKYQNFHWE